MSGRRLALLVAVLLTMPGCLYVSGRAAIGQHLDPAVVDGIVPGRTTKGELLALLGPPNEYKRPETTAALSDDRARIAGALAAARRAEDVFTWQQDRLTASGTWLVVLTLAWSRTDTDLLVVWFDSNDVVVDVALRTEERR